MQKQAALICFTQKNITKMPVQISFPSKLKPAFLTSFKEGKNALDTDEKASDFLSSFAKTISSICSQLDSDPSNVKGSEVVLIIINNCVTLSDKKPQEVFMMIPPEKESQFQIKALCNNPLVKGNKQAAIYQLTAVGEKEEDLHLINLTKMSGKLKLSGPLFQQLVKLGKLKGLKFRKAQNDEEETEGAEEQNTDNAPQQEASPVALLVNELQKLKTQYETAKSVETLKEWAALMERFKQVIVQHNTAETKAQFSYWGQQFVEAKNNLAKETNKSNTPPKAQSALESQIQALSKQVKQTPNTDFNGLMALLSECQQIRTAPTSKTEFQQNPNLVEQFKQLRKEISDKMQGEVKNQLASDLNNPAQVKETIKKEIKLVWEDFVKNAENAETFSSIAENVVAALIEGIKGFQKMVSDKSQGMIEAAKMLNIGDEVVISQNMTEVRSALTKLKAHMQEQYKQITLDVKQMADLENEFHKTQDSSKQQALIDKISQIANGLKWETTWDAFSY